MMQLNLILHHKQRQYMHGISQHVTNERQKHTPHHFWLYQRSRSALERIRLMATMLSDQWCNDIVHLLSRSHPSSSAKIQQLMPT